MIHFKKTIICLCIFAIVCFALVNVVSAADVTINPKNGTLENVVNKYDTIYLDDGVYKGDSNRNINVSRNTTIIGLNKGGAVIDDEYIASLFEVNPKTSLTLINVTFINRVSSISNQGVLTISNTTFNNSRSHMGIIWNIGVLRISGSSFNNNSFLINSFVGNDVIESCEFKNNKAGSYGIMTFRGMNRNIRLFNLTFINNSASIALVTVKGSYVNASVLNSIFINSKCNLLAITGEFSPSVGSKLKPSNITEINTTINYEPYINLGVYLKNKGLVVLKATLKHYNLLLPNQKLYFYVDGKFVGSAVTDKKGVATFNYNPSHLNFTVQVVLNKHTDKNSTTTASYERTSFKGLAYKYVVGSSKIVYNSSSALKKRGSLYYKKIYVKNLGDSFGSKTFLKKLYSKYNLVRYTFINMVFKYNKAKRSFSVKVTNLLPYNFSKKQGVLTLVLRKRY
ncbi:MAG: hypothetical protein ACRCVG_06805 [Methanobacteriaceae archaeon]